MTELELLKKIGIASNERKRLSELCWEIYWKPGAMPDAKGEAYLEELMLEQETIISELIHQLNMIRMLSINN